MANVGSIFSVHAEFDPTQRKLVGVVRLPCTACLAGQHTEQVGYPQGYFCVG